MYLDIKLQFFLLVGKTILFSDWNKQIQQSLENSITQIQNQVDNVILEDHTYSQDPNSRCLRSLVRALQRLLSILKRRDDSLTNKNINKDLSYSIVSGNE